MKAVCPKYEPLEMVKMKGELCCLFSLRHVKQNSQLSGLLHWRTESPNKEIVAVVRISLQNARQYEDNERQSPRESLFWPPVLNQPIKRAKLIVKGRKGRFINVATVGRKRKRSSDPPKPVGDWVKIQNKNKEKMKSSAMALWDKELLQMPMSSFSVSYILLGMQPYP